jgi:hypothetical protein
MSKVVTIYENLLVLAFFLFLGVVSIGTLFTKRRHNLIKELMRDGDNRAG